MAGRKDENRLYVGARWKKWLISSRKKEPWDIERVARACGAPNSRVRKWLDPDAPITSIEPETAYAVGRAIGNRDYGSPGLEALHASGHFLGALQILVEMSSRRESAQYATTLYCTLPALNSWVEGGVQEDLLGIDWFAAIDTADQDLGIMRLTTEGEREWATGVLRKNRPIGFSERHQLDGDSLESRIALRRRRLANAEEEAANVLRDPALFANRTAGDVLLECAKGLHAVLRWEEAGPHSWWLLQSVFRAADPTAFLQYYEPLREYFIGNDLLVTESPLEHAESADRITSDGPWRRIETALNDESNKRQRGVDGED